MITKEVLQKFVDNHLDEIAQVLPGGLKNKDGKWLLVCPIMERFDLDFSKVPALANANPAEEKVEKKGVIDTVKEKIKKKRSKKK